MAVPSSLLVRVVFGALVLATLGAFVVTQRLKRSTPIVERVYYYVPCPPPHQDKRCSRSSFSPLAAPPAGRVRLRFYLPKRRDSVTVSVVDASGQDVRTLVDDRTLHRGFHTYTWNGRTDADTIAPDGVYRLRVTLRAEGRALTAPRTIALDTRPPRPRIVRVAPRLILPGAPELDVAQLRYKGPSNPAPLVRVWRTDLPKPRLVVAFPAPRFRQSAKWNGLLADQTTPAPDGVYELSVTVYDKAGNAGSAPALLPPRHGQTPPRSGVQVRYLTLSGPLEPVSSGGVARFQIGPVARRMRWNLSPLGLGAPLARGTAGSRTLAVRVPRHTHTGLYLLRVEAGGHRAVAPLAVRGPGHARVLVVLPAIAWQGLNQWDDDGDGFPNLLSAGDSVALDRPFAHGLPPAGLQQQVAPLMRFLDRERLPYELTTDLALARGRGPGPAGHSGVLFAGNETWLTDRLDVALRNYVDRGGHVASFGVDSFRRMVSVGPTELSDPTGPERVNVFGEQTSPLAIAAAPMVVSQNGLGLFTHTDGILGGFQQFEQSDRLVEGARVLAAAGRDRKHPAFVAYGLGKGIVVRAGSPQWAVQLAGDPELTDVTMRIWSLLSQ